MDGMYSIVAISLDWPQVMPYWVINCKNCRRVFSHSKIEDTLANYFVPEKPKFLDAGDRIACPHCHAIEKYECTDLKYQVKLDFSVASKAR